MENNEKIIFTFNKNTFKTVLTVIISVIALIPSIWFIAADGQIAISGLHVYSDIVYDLLIFIAGIVMALGVSGIIFSFVKPRAWLYETLTGSCAILCAVTMFTNYINNIDVATSYNITAEGWACFVYALAVFTAAMVIRAIYAKKQSKKLTA